MSEPRFYSLDLAGIPDEEWNADCDRSRAWPKHCRSTSDKAGFPTNTLSSTAEIEEWPHWERKVGFALYVSLNVIPVSLLPLLLAWLLLPGSLSNTAGCMLLAALGYILALLAGNHAAGQSSAIIVMLQLTLCACLSVDFGQTFWSLQVRLVYESSLLYKRRSRHRYYDGKPIWLL